MNKKISAILLMVLFFISCKKENQKESFPDKTNNNLKYFGYTLIDVGWDDPTDNEYKTNYIDEVQDFSNIADILVINPTENIINRLHVFDRYKVKAVLHLSEIFFELKNTGGHKSGFIYGLRSDYRQRWDAFISVNDLINNHIYINSFYVGEEPSWNGIPEDEFKEACDYIKSTIPQVPILVIEAYPDIHNIYTPVSVDLVGFDHYFLPRPLTDTVFLNELLILKSKIKTHQKIFLVMDAHWIEFLHGNAGITENDMATIARDYYKIANSDTTIVGIIGNFWPSGLDVNSSVGPEIFLKMF